MSEGVCANAAEALRWGTLDGARALGLDNRIGSITPGKRADLLFHNARSITLAAWDCSQPEATLLIQAGVSDLLGVMVSSVLVKRDGQLRANEQSVCDLLTAANDRLRDEIERRGGRARALEVRLALSSAPRAKEGRGVMTF